jgi:hypothetical protein
MPADPARLLRPCSSPLSARCVIMLDVLFLLARRQPQNVRGARRHHAQPDADRHCSRAYSSRDWRHWAAPRRRKRMFLLQRLPGHRYARICCWRASLIGTLGVLDDVTISQSSAVMELKRANPLLSARELYRKCAAHRLRPHRRHGEYADPRVRGRLAAAPPPAGGRPRGRIVAHHDQPRNPGN